MNSLYFDVVPEQPAQNADPGLSPGQGLPIPLSDSEIEIV